MLPILCALWLTALSMASWADYISEVDRLSKITKEELVAFVNEHFADNYIRVDKIEKKDPTDTRIAKPAITPIFTNRDTSSAFLREIQASQVKPIEPVFVDFEKDMDILTAKNGIQVLYKQNTINDLFTSPISSIRAAMPTRCFPLQPTFSVIWARAK